MFFNQGIPGVPYDGWERKDRIDFMNFQRYLCSQLVAFRNSSAGDRIVNLEEIWKSGAVLESEEPVEEGTKVEIRCGSAFFAGRISHVELHEFGWRFEVEFSPMTPWSPEQFRPEHLLDPSTLDRGLES
jgi:hypothetical protein